MKEQLEDQAIPARSGEELDLVALKMYLEEAIPEHAGEIELLQFPSGYSNLTYLLRVNDNELVLRRPPFGAKIKSAHDMSREFKILKALETHYPQAPKAIAFCEDDSVIGAPFYIMERMPGIILRKEIPEDLNITDSTMNKLCKNFIENLVAIHSIDWQSTDLAELGHPEGYVERQISGWIGRYEKAQTDSHAHISDVMSWLDMNKPQSEQATLIHNDYKFDNLVLNTRDITRIEGVLDWEMATIGDPLMDLGTSLAYWVEANDAPELQALRFCPTHLPGVLTREELVKEYLQLANISSSNMLFYYVYGIFKLAVIIQQIYKRYVEGHSSDPRFKHLNLAVEGLANHAYRAIQTERISS